MQYQSECRNALESAVNISKSFQKVFMDAMKLFMAIPDRINFLQMGRYGCFSEQTYRNNFENDGFDWFSFNEAIIREHLKGGRKAIAVDPSFIPKSGSKTPWIGYFWSGCAGEYKRGLEITGIGVIDVDNHECMTLGSVQTPDNATLESCEKNLVDWYSSYLISIQEQLKRISGTVVCDAFFSKATFIKPQDGTLIPSIYDGIDFPMTKLLAGIYRFRSLLDAAPCETAVPASTAARNTKPYP